MAKWQFTKGLHDIGNGLFAYLQPDGSWGWANAGLIVGGEESLLIDTLSDLPLTREMLDTMKGASRAAVHIDKLVNTHANADHIWGNQLVADAEIIGSRACAEDFDLLRPETFHDIMSRTDELGVLGEYFERLFKSFDYSGIKLTPPTTTFDDRLTLTCGDKTVELYNVGPAHTRGDVLAYIPGDRTIFTGDILFVGTHPVMWDGPIGNWRKACDMIVSLDVDIVVPGHGPITDKAGVRSFRGYLDYVEAEARARFDAGVDEWEAAQDISLAEYDSWLDAERIYANVAALYREFRGDTEAPDLMQIFTKMAELDKVMRQGA